jgi:hypothetical protein
MRIVILSAAAVLLSATPALANEARVEARTSIVFDSGFSTGSLGVAGGYDYDLGSMAFVGAEVSADKLLDRGTRVAFGFTGRAGVNATENDKVFAAGGYTTKPCALCENAVNVGAGWQHSFGQVYAKVEYRHFFARNDGGDTDAVSTGIGFRF